ncbi:hypothetical protein FLL45_22540 [Aliikangiella marina]|uniref:Uncharacterized protein n=1 Tax=Aliikangiella marina TaxID=1712262 RepID=A0A545T1K1_9GAMM|nr:hypothetical protein [Aliikangiella marina]TQV71108.1 hypothetical protein FLL45_22540 [Aliikangiella marina]
MESYWVFIVILTATLLVFFVLLFLRNKKASQLAYIDNYLFPEKVRIKIKEKYSHLSERQIEKVLDGLKEYFIICRQSKNYQASMPSRVVDLAWHEFILFTKQYNSFCQNAFGRFLHHTPTEAMASSNSNQLGTRNAWHYSCLNNGIDPKAAATLPLLFAIDEWLEIKDGCRYSKEDKERFQAYEDISTNGIEFDFDSDCGSGCGGD